MVHPPCYQTFFKVQNTVIDTSDILLSIAKECKKKFRIAPTMNACTSMYIYGGVCAEKRESIQLMIVFDCSIDEEGTLEPINWIVNQLKLKFEQEDVVLCKIGTFQNK